MALGRREISAILLAVGALLFYVVFLLSAQSGAQTIVITNVTDRFITDEFIEDVVIDDEFQVEPPPDFEPRKRQPTNIINIPRKPLPPSGGVPVYGVVASFILAATGLLALGIGIRRGLRR